MIRPRARIGGLVTRAVRAFLVRCMPTENTTAGPVYRKGAPWRTRLCSPGEPGDALAIVGTVTRQDCRSLAETTLDVWQTNARGWYSNLLGLSDPAKPGTFHLRGRMLTDHEGRYRFDTVVPGRYPFFWPFTRPCHIHMIVTHPSCKTLTTQIFFEGDPYNRWDPWWKSSLTIHLDAHAESDGRRISVGTFDIVLEPE
jgi:catechol 1,2-dioxygenase